MNYAGMLLQPADSVQIARWYYHNRGRLVPSSTPSRKPKPGKRKTGRQQWKPEYVRRDFMKSGEFAEYDTLTVVSRRTPLDPDRTEKMAAKETKLWDMCAADHKNMGTSTYSFYLAKRIARFESMACMGSNTGDETESFVAFRRLIAILVQEREMLDMKDAELKAAGFDGAFIALGRCLRARGFKAQTGWFTESELRARRAVKTIDATMKSEDLPVGDSDT